MIRQPPQLVRILLKFLLGRVSKAVFSFIILDENQWGGEDNFSAWHSGLQREPAQAENRQAFGNSPMKETVLLRQLWGTFKILSEEVICHHEINDSSKKRD